jgi:uncharacterized LabA/DUF88 family protein
VGLKAGPFGGAYINVARTLYFDAEPTHPDGPLPELAEYWNSIDAQDDTHLVFGWVRGKSNKRGPRQKAVDTSLAVELVASAYTKRFDVAILVAGDGDFVPIVNEVRRAGPHIVVAAASDSSSPPKFSYSSELRTAADRFVSLPGDPTSSGYKHFFKSMDLGNTTMSFE